MYGTHKNSRTIYLKYVDKNQPHSLTTNSSHKTPTCQRHPNHQTWRQKFRRCPYEHKKYINLPPMHPIISHLSSLLSPSAQFIDHVLQPLAMSYQDYIQNSTALTLHLQDTTVPDHAILVTVDVTNLYPSIPQSECLSIIHVEMHNKFYLFTFDPNFITHLLHININYNYLAI